MKFILAALVLAFTVGFTSPSFAEDNCSWATFQLNQDVKMLRKYHDLLVQNRWDIHLEEGKNLSPESEKIIKRWRAEFHELRLAPAAQLATIKMAVCENNY